MTVRSRLRRAGLVLAAALLAPSLALVATAAPVGASEPKLVVRGGGWGHGVGMSQYGAEGMARQGRSATQILQHYYQGVSIQTHGPWNDLRVLLEQADATYEVTATWAFTVTCTRGGSATINPGQVLRVGGNATTLWVKRNDDEVCGSPIAAGSSGARASVDLGGKPVTLRRGGATVGTYGRGTLELSTGVPGCGKSVCAVARGLTMDEYLYGLAEVPSSWSPATLQAQAITGRSYAALRHASPRAPGLYHILATTTDQYYAGWSKESEPTYGARWKAAVDATSGRVLTYGGKIVSANYFSTSGGRTENSEYVWTAATPYLRSVPDPTDSISPRHAWTREYTLREIGSWFGVSNVRDVRIVGGVGVSGRTDKATIEIVGSTTKRVTGNQFRSTINARVPDSRALWSTKFTLATSSFPDVAPGAYYAKAVDWLTDEGITTGVGDTGLFKPDESVTRAQMVTFLWRMMGSPKVTRAHGFVDVPAGSWYDQAVRWAKAQGITTGVSGTNRFAPNDVVNRAQMATFLHRVAGLKAPSARHRFPDVPSSAWYDRAVSWAAQHQITTGVGDTGLYKPLERVTRGQMAAFLHRTASTEAAWAVPLPPTAP